MNEEKFVHKLQHTICLFILICISVSADAQDPISKADRSVVRVVVKLNDGYSFGSGFVVGPGGVVATNNHVVSGGASFLVFNNEGDGKLKKYDAHLLRVWPDYDLALLQVSGLAVPPLPLATKLPPKGSAVNAIGYPGIADKVLGGKVAVGESTVTQGIIGRVVVAPWSADGKKLNILQHSAAVNSGNSGGPLIDLCGRVVGVNTGKALGQIIGNREKGFEVDQSDGIFFASHSSALLAILKAQGVQYSSTDVECDPARVQSTTYQIPPASSQQDWPSTIVVVIALLVAFGALLVALRKSTVVTETYTQYRARSGGGKTTVKAPSKKPWILRGLDSFGRSVEFVVDARLFSNDALVIGRDSKQAQFFVDDPTLSRRHATLSLSTNGMQLADLGSLNGTWVDGVPIGGKPVSLHHGQTLTLGKVSLRVYGAE